MTYEETVSYLYTLRNRGTKLGLEPITRVLSSMGNPHRRFQSIHVGGTNGKGSVAAMLNGILGAAGCRCGLYTSPHLVSFTERIVVDGDAISEAEVVRRAGEVLEHSQNLGLGTTFFEVATAAAFAHFADHGVAWVVAEVGLGGRLDATNVLTPDVAVITNVDMDHQSYLGGTIEEIAAEKAGILKQGVPACTGAGGTALEIIRRVARDVGAPLAVLNEDFSATVTSTGVGYVVIDYQDQAGSLSGIRIPLNGLHQAGNAALALKTWRLIAPAILDWPGDEAPVRDGLLSVRWPGRMEALPWDGAGTLLVDPAHNGAAASALAKTIKQQYADHPPIWIIGILEDKDVGDIVRPLAELGGTFIATRPPGDRALDPGVLGDALGATGCRVEITGGMSEALSVAKSLSRDGSVVIVTGSFYTVGEVKGLLGERGPLSSLRE